jgi:hypothetical protein
MEDFRRALDATKIKSTGLKQLYVTDTINLINLLREGKVQKFNELRSESKISGLSFSAGFF